MTIGVDIRPMAGQRTGIQEYTEQILAHLIPLAPEHKFKLFFSSLRQRLPEHDWLKAPNVEIHNFKIPNNLMFFSGGVWEFPKLDRLIGGADVFFSPHFFLAPLSNECRRVTTFHDLSYLRFPEFFTWRKRFWHTVEMNPASQARFSDRLIAVSESTKKDLIELYKIDPVNIEVVPLGVKMTAPDEKELVEFKKKHQLSERFIFYLGTIEPRKNVSGLVGAFNLLKERAGFEDVELVIAGKKGWHFEDVLDGIADSPYAAAIRYVGHISDEERPFFYTAASAFIYPSFFEGFGSPVLEAMACGAPVITSPNSSLPEVAGQAALYVNPYNLSDMAEAMRILVSDEAVREKIKKIGLEQAKKFSWQTAAEKTLQILTRG